MTSPAEELHPAPVLEPGKTILELRGLEKRYPGTHALKPIDLAFRAGEIHAIVGENGAGKSTLIKLLTGVMPRTSGEVFWEGAPVALATPHEAMALRHQRRSSGSRVVPPPLCRGQHVPRRGRSALRHSAAARHGA